MPIEPRPQDTFTRNALLLGFSTIEWNPALSTGGFGPPVELGILESQELTKEVETLTLRDGSSGTLVINREIIGSFAAALAISTFNWSANVARYMLGSDVLTAISADPVAPFTGDPVTAPLGSDATRIYLALTHQNVAEGSVAITGSAVEDEEVQGSGGAVMGDFQLAYKITDAADVSSIYVTDSLGNQTVYTPVDTGSETGTGNEAVFNTAGAAATSGEIRLDVGGVPTNLAAGSTLNCSYDPTISGVLDTDFAVDPWNGRVRFLALDTFAAPDGASVFRQGQTADVDYTYDRLDGFTLQPFRQLSFEGKATIRHLPDVGINFVWPVPSATIQITDDAVTFGAEDFAVGPLRLNINDAGGTQRYGSLQWSTESQAAA